MNKLKYVIGAVPFVVTLYIAITEQHIGAALALVIVAVPVYRMVKR